MTTAYQKATTVIAGAASVTALVGTRYWADLRETDDLPAITYRLVTDTRNDHLDAPGKGKFVRIQFNCWAKSRAAAEALADALEVALSAEGRVLLRISSYDPDVEIYWTQLDWQTGLLSPT